MRKQAATVFLILLFIYGCVETEPVSTIPAIEFKSFEVTEYFDPFKNTLSLSGTLQFTFIDGDADLGYENMPDTTDPFDINNYNVIIIPFEKLEGKYYEIEFVIEDSNSVPPYYNIKADPKFERVGQNKTLKGTITIDILYDFVPEYDTLRYEFYIFDRARNQSNIAVTDDIGFTGYRNGNNGTNGF